MDSSKLTPQQWLLHRIAQAGPKQTRVLAIRLACKMDPDTIQEVFESEMACDGYFAESLLRAICGIIS